MLGSRIQGSSHAKAAGRQSAKAPGLLIFRADGMTIRANGRLIA